MAAAMSREEFGGHVELALAELPEPFAGLTAEVRVEVADEPTADQLARAGVGRGRTLLGLYQGVPRTERTVDMTGTLPDVIWVFQGPIQRQCRSAAEVARQIRTTVLHEVGHHFGLSENDLTAAGYG